MATFKLHDLQQELHQIECRINERGGAGCVEDENHEQAVAGKPIENVPHQSFGKLAEAFIRDCWILVLLELIGGDYPNLRPPDEVNSRTHTVDGILTIN